MAQACRGNPGSVGGVIATTGFFAAGSYPCILKVYISICKDDKAASGSTSACFVAAFSGRRRLAFDIKLGSAPVPTRGFWSALSDLKPDAAFVVYPSKERYPLGQGVEALPVSMPGEVLDA